MGNDIKNGLYELQGLLELMVQGKHDTKELWDAVEAKYNELSHLIKMNHREGVAIKQSATSEDNSRSYNIETEEEKLSDKIKETVNIEPVKGVETPTEETSSPQQEEEIGADAEQDIDFVMSDIIREQPDSRSALEHEIDDDMLADASAFEQEEDADIQMSGDDYAASEPEETEIKPMREVVNTSREVKKDEVRSRRSLRKSLSLNDVFRFRRELFGGNDRDYRASIDVIDSYSTFEEAEDYLLNDLQWDASNPVVEEFMDIVKRHFQS